MLRSLHARGNMNQLIQTPAPALFGPCGENAAKDFGAVTRLVAASFGVASCTISLRESPATGLQGESPLPLRASVFCSEVAATGQMLVVEDALLEQRFASLAQGASATAVRFYAGAPLLGSQDNCIGVLCIMDDAPRTFSSAERAWLAELAELVVQDLSLRRAVGRVDPVSGLPNRHQLVEDMARARIGAATVSIMAHLEIPPADTGLEIVTTFGAEVYEDILGKIAQGVQDTFGAHAYVYHLSGGQFVLVSRGEEGGFVDVLHSGADTLQSRLKLRQIPMRLHGHGGYVEFSSRDMPAEVCRKALSAAHVACVRNLVWAAYDRDEDALAQRSFRLIQDFPSALEQEQLRLVYQPKLDLVSEELSSAEALVRWRHPELGDISPAEFIPLIEKTRLIRPFTHWVMETAIGQLGSWIRDGLLSSLAINLSGKNFKEADLAERLAGMCDRHQVAPSSLEIECTEGILMAEHCALQMLAEVRSLGARIAIDDFGTGYSNIAYLQNIPATSLKLDRSLIRHIAVNPRQRVLLEALLQMARNLSYEVVVEGVETQQQFDMLCAMQVDVMQGYFISRALEQEEFEQFVGDYHRHIRRARAGPMPPPRSRYQQIQRPLA